jgi:methyl-accepting chemotaxis protein
VSGDDISLVDLFDETYVPVSGSNPLQHLTRFVALTDRLFTPIQESVLEWSDRVTFCAAGANLKPFLVQTYRRDMGGGTYAILKEVDAPIKVRGRLWGNLRLAFCPSRL